MVEDGAGAGGLAPGADAGLVAAEMVNVGLNPLEDGALVVQAGVGECFGVFHGTSREETVCAELGGFLVYVSEFKEWFF